MTNSMDVTQNSQPRRPIVGYTSRLHENSPRALGIERVVDDEFFLQDLAVAQPKGAESVSDPAESFAGRMRLPGSRVSRTHNLRQQCQRRVGQSVPSENGVEGNPF